MNPQQRIVASLTIVFVMLFAAIGASFVSRSGAQAANTQAAVDLGNRLDPGTTITPGTTPGTTVGTTSPPPTTANPGCEQDGTHDVADCVANRLDPSSSTTSTTAGTNPPGTNAPGTTAPTTTAAPSTTAATSC